MFPKHGPKQVKEFETVRTRVSVPRVLSDDSRMPSSVVGGVRAVPGGMVRCRERRFCLLPRVPVRQWVLSLPHRLRYLLAWDHRLCRAVLGVFIRALPSSSQAGEMPMKLQIARAKEIGAIVRKIIEKWAA